MIGLAFDADDVSISEQPTQAQIAHMMQIQNIHNQQGHGNGNGNEHGRPRISTLMSGVSGLTDVSFGVLKSQNGGASPVTKQQHQVPHRHFSQMSSLGSGLQFVNHHIQDTQSQSSAFGLGDPNFIGGGGGHGGDAHGKKGVAVLTQQNTVQTLQTLNESEVNMFDGGGSSRGQRKGTDDSTKLRINSSARSKLQLESKDTVATEATIATRISHNTNDSIFTTLVRDINNNGTVHRNSRSRPLGVIKDSRELDAQTSATANSGHSNNNNNNNHNHNNNNNENGNGDGNGNGNGNENGDPSQMNEDELREQAYQARLAQAKQLRAANAEYKVHLGFGVWGSTEVTVPASTIPAQSIISPSAVSSDSEDENGNGKNANANDKQNVSSNKNNPGNGTTLKTNVSDGKSQASSAVAYV